MKNQTFCSSPGTTVLNSGAVCELRREMVTGSAQLWALQPFLSGLLRNNLFSALVIVYFCHMKSLVCCGIPNSVGSKSYICTFLCIFIDLIWVLTDFSYWVTLCKCDICILRTMKIFQEKTFSASVFCLSLMNAISLEAGNSQFPFE